MTKTDIYMSLYMYASSLSAYLSIHLSVYLSIHSFLHYCIHACICFHRETDIQTDRQAGRQADGQTDRQTDKQRERERESRGGVSATNFPLALELRLLGPVLLAPEPGLGVAAVAAAAEAAGQELLPREQAGGMKMTWIICGDVSCCQYPKGHGFYLHIYICICIYVNFI